MQGVTMPGAHQRKLTGHEPSGALALERVVEQLGSTTRLQCGVLRHSRGSAPLCCILMRCGRCVAHRELNAALLREEEGLVGDRGLVTNNQVGAIHDRRMGGIRGNQDPEASLPT
jgi:hypothetical protein